MNFLLAWQNLIFLIPILVGIVASLALATGFGGEVGEGEVEHGESAEMDDASTDNQSDALALEVGDDASDHGEGHADHNVIQHALSLLGVGKVPLSIVIMLSGLSFGITGLLSNVFLRTITNGSGLGALVSMSISFCVMFLVTASCAKAMSKIVPSFETRTVSQRGLLGLQAHLILPASPTSGLAHVRDQFGTLHQIRCRTTHGEIPDGRDVVAYDYDEEERVYLVTEEIPMLARTQQRSVSHVKEIPQERSVDEQESSQLATEQRKQSE